MAVRVSSPNFLCFLLSPVLEVFFLSQESDLSLYLWTTEKCYPYPYAGSFTSAFELTLCTFTDLC